MTVLWIALAGALGCAARYGVGVWVTRATATASIPWGTFVVNAIGSLAIGATMALFAARGELDSRLRLTITVGFLGGFTTYSAFAYETIALLERKQVTAAAAYVALTFIAAGAACAAGLIAVRALVR